MFFEATPMMVSAQSTGRSVRITRQSAAEALTAFGRDLLDFVEGHVMLVVVLVVVGFVVFGLTRPRVH